MVKLQLALDFLSVKEALKIAGKVWKYVDILEAGTPLIKAEGIKVIGKLKRFGKPVLADLKTMDTGFLEAEMAFRAGADLTTVCGSAPLETIKGAIKAGRKYRKKVMVDLIGIKSRKRIEEILKLEPDYICFHLGIDEQTSGQELTRKLKSIKNLGIKNLAVAGGISPENVRSVMVLKPKIVVVGSAITRAEKPEEVAKRIKGMIC